MSSLRPIPDEEDEIPFAVAIPAKFDPLEVDREDQTEHRHTHSKLLVVIGLLVIVILILVALLCISLPGYASVEQHYEPISIDGEQISPDCTPPSWDETAAMCHIPSYEVLPDPSCEALNNRGHTNSYWENEKFLCRLEERPCDTEPGTYFFQLDLGSDGGILNLYGSILQPREVWAVSSDKEGRLKQEGSCFESFWSENVCHNLDNTPPPIDTLADYVFGSLECCEDPDDDDRFYIIIDGVLVDSCPKSVIEKCRDCSD